LTNQTAGVAGEASVSGEQAPTNRAAPQQLLVRFRAGVGRAQQQAVLASTGPKVKTFRWVGARKGGVAVQAPGGAAGSVFHHLALVELEEGADVGAAIRRFGRRPEVLYAEPNYRLRICQEPLPPLLPNDFELAKCWGLNNTGQSGGEPDADIDAPEAWALSVGDRRVKVAVIDTGIDFFHPDLEENIWTNPGEIPGNGIDDDQNGYIDDVHGYDFVSDDSDPMDDQSHGTHVAGIIGAVGNNHIGSAGVCWQVSLMALKAFDEKGDGLLADVIEAIDYAVQNGAQVLNASWSSPERSRALEEAVAEAHLAGMVVVAAAGNDRSGVPPYPAAYDAVVSVAATNSKDQRASFSNYGARTDVAAPGETIFSTIPNNTYDYRSGTSMAAPHVSGVAALVLARHPEFTNLEVETILRNAVDSIHADQYIGAGRINAWKALAIETPLPVAKLKLPAIISGRLALRGTAKGERFAGYSLEYGRDIYPTNWTPFLTANQPVDDAALAEGFSTAVLEEGVHTLRLTVTDTLGQQAVDRAIVTVRNVCMSWPMHNDVLRAGETIAIRGTVFGPGRSYSLEHGVGWQPTQWSTAGIILANDGAQEVVDGLLGSWQTVAVRTNQFYELRLTAREGGQRVGEWLTQLVYLDGQLRPGWPQYLPIEGDYPTNDWREVSVADLDQDGFAEILRVDPGNSDGKVARLLVYQYDGNLWWSQPLASGEPYFDTPVVGDINGDGLLEVFVDVGGQLFGFGPDGRPLPGNWPLALEASNLGKVIADVDGDGRKELIALAQDPVRKGDQDWRQLLVFNQAGDMLRCWDLQACDLSVDAPKMFPAVGNLDGEPDLEIVAVTGCNQLGVFKLSKPDGPVWTALVDGFLVGSPVVGDINHDGKNEIVIGAYDPRLASRGGTRGGLYAFNGSGRPLPGWPVLVSESFAATPALADFDFDGDLEIVIPSWSSQRLHLVHHDGFEGLGWPLGPFNHTSIKSAPLIGDVNGDWQMEVVMVSPGKPMPTALTGDFSTVGGVMAWDLLGRQIDLNDQPDLMGLVMESAGGSPRNKAAALTLADLDGDGNLDIVATTIEDFAYSPVQPYTNYKHRYSIYVWATPFPYVATNMAWPTLQHDPQHTGYLELPKPVNQPPVVGGIPDQTVKTGTAFFPIELDRYVDDPDNQPGELKWTVRGNTNLQVVIGADRSAIIRPLEPNWSGEETIHFIATDPGGLSSESAAVFAARTDYEPPVANDDEATTPEDEPVEIDVLANDRDPRGYPLRVIQFSRPKHGVAQAVSAGRVLYQPAANFNGDDSFTYTVNNGKDGMAMGLVKVKVLPVEDPPEAVADRAITVEDTPVTIEVLDNDTDPDGDSLSLLDFTQPANGSVSLASDTNLVYTPKPYFNGLDSFTYRISDGHGGQSEGEVTVMIKPVNDPPVGQDQVFALNRNSQQELTFLATDPDGDELTFAVVKGPEHGELWAYPKVATYYPQKGYVGPDSFTYQASDGVLESQITTVSFTMLDQDNPPQTESQSVVTKVGQPLSITLQATDADEDPMSFQILRTPAYGTLSGSGTNYVYQPEPGFVGNDEFSYQASDGQLSSPETAVRIKVTDQNTAPVAVDSTATVRMNTPTELSLVASDGEANPLTYTILTSPAHGQLGGVAPNLIFTPETNYLGPDRLIFKASDGELESDAATVSIHVVVPNHQPEGRDQELTVLRDQASALLLDLRDADGDPLRCVILKGPKYGRLAGLGTNYVYTPQPLYAGMDSFTYRAWDGCIYSAITKVTITVKSPPLELKPSFEKIIRTDDGQVQLTLKVQPGKNLCIQSSTNLLDWNPLAKLAPGSSPITLTDTNAPASLLQFYRAVQY
jgi:subtilisin family serine protease